MAEPAGKPSGRVWQPLPPRESADLPPRELPFWKQTGPGAVLVGLSIGAGEIIIWPRLAAEFGPTILWAAVLGVFIQLWINLEVGRWTIATGESIFTGYQRVWRGFAPIFIAFTFLGWLAPGWARASGLSLKGLLVGPEGWGGDTVWTAITFAVIVVVLFGPKIVYESVEHTIEALVLIVVLGLIAVAVAAGTADTWRDVGLGLLSVGQIPAGIPIKDLFGAVAFAGAGGTANLFYSYYLRDKKIGMGARVPQLTNPFRSRSEAAVSSGFDYLETPQNAHHFRAWLRYVIADQAIFFFFLNALTMMLFIFGALAVLRPNGLVPAPGRLIFDEATVLSRIWGRPGQVIFLLVGFATLFSTQLTVVDGVARSLADMIHTSFRFAQRRSQNWWYLICAAGWIIAGCWLTFVMERLKVSDLGFILNSAYMGGLAMAVYVPLTLYLNLRHLPRSARPAPLNIVMMVVATGVYVGFAICSLVWQFAK
ncbi:MAG: Nramp family divalent metal transporter [Armatimonadetes bacterium]|nr:Nramp family divalent metal transporter [Armatimonadota bacterium]